MKMSHDSLPDNIKDNGEIFVETGPEIFARESVVDSFISLVNDYKNADSINIINVPRDKTVSDIANSIGIGTGGIRYDEDVNEVYIGPHCNYVRTYNSDDDSCKNNDIEEKIDATYNKLCSLEITNTDALDVVHQVSGQLENINRNCVVSAKFVREINEKVENLDARFTHMMNDLISIKQLLISVVRQNSYYDRKIYE